MNHQQSAGKGSGECSNEDKILRECASCDKSATDLKRCTACKSVWYCDVACQKAHRKAHKKECKRIARGLGSLRSERNIVKITPLKREDCPICMIPLPLRRADSLFKFCCGKNICGGCHMENKRVASNSASKLCPFCRSPPTEGFEERAKLIQERIDKGDAEAIFNAGTYYANGQFGFEVNKGKAIALFTRAAKLDHGRGCARLAYAYLIGDFGLEKNVQKARYYFERAVRVGDIEAHHNLAVMQISLKVATYQTLYLLKVAAASGYEPSLKCLEDFREAGCLSEEELEDLREAQKKAEAETKSDERDNFLQHMKSIGKSYEDLALSHRMI